MKKILLILCLCLGFSIISFAEEMPSEIPADAPAQGERRMPEGFPGGEKTDGFTGKMPGGNRTPPEGMEPMTPPENFENQIAPAQQEQPGTMPETSENSTGTPAPSAESQEENHMQNGFPQGGGRPSFGEQDFSRGEAEPKSFWEEYFTPLLSGVLLAGAFLFVLFYRRKHY